MIVTKSVFGVHFLDNEGEPIYDLQVDDLQQAKSDILDYIREVEHPVITDNRDIFDLLKKDTRIKIDTSSRIIRKFRLNKLNHLISTHYNSREAYLEDLRGKAILRTRDQVKNKAEGRDVIITHTVYAIDDLSKSLNQTHNRLVELYNIHFPELVLEVNNPSTYAKIVQNFPLRSEMTTEKLVSIGLNEKNAKEIMSLVSESLGADLEKADLVNAQHFAELYLTVNEKKLNLERWMEKTMQEIAPNLTAVAGATVGAKLISKIGSLQGLAMKSSSKIQTLGAEKALYSAIKSGGDTPKHGIIFQIPEIGISPFWLRGKIARAFASRIAIAARLDAFDGEFLGDKYRAELSKLVDDLKKKYPNAPPQKVRKRKKKSGKKGSFKKKKGKKGGRR